jgi:hypothetical protein
MPQMLLAEDHEMVQALAADSHHSSFGRSIHVRRPHGNRFHFHAVRREDGVELRHELGVAVARQVRRRVPLVGKEGEAEAAKAALNAATPSAYD